MKNVKIEHSGWAFIDDQRSNDWNWEFVEFMFNREINVIKFCGQRAIVLVSV